MAHRDLHQDQDPVDTGGVNIEIERLDREIDAHIALDQEIDQYMPLEQRGWCLILGVAEIIHFLVQKVRNSTK